MPWPVTSLRSREGGSFRLTIRMSRSPSLSKSPKAHPRLECGADMPGPCLSQTVLQSARFPSCGRARGGVLYGYCGSFFSTSGYTLPVTEKRSGLPSLSRSDNPGSPTDKARLHPKAGAHGYIRKAGFAVVDVKRRVSSAKCVFRISRLPSRLKSPTRAPSRPAPARLRSGRRPFPGRFGEGAIVIVPEKRLGVESQAT